MGRQEHKFKDTFAHHLIWNRWRGSSAQGQRPEQWADKGNHDEPSAEKNIKMQESIFCLNKTICFVFRTSNIILQQ